MNNAVQKMGEDVGIPDEDIRFDAFGGYFYTELLSVPHLTK
jgi:hypothetical protein